MHDSRNNKWASITVEESIEAARIIRDKDVRKFVIYLIREHDARVFQQGNKHLRVLHPTTGEQFPIGCSSSDHRARQRIKQDARHSGFHVSPGRI